MSNNFNGDFCDSTQIYYRELRNCTPISREKETILLRKAKEGDRKAKQELMVANLKFVFDTVKNYKGRGVPLSDLISEGNLGLSHAIDKFDLNSGVKLISYAVWWVKYYVQKTLKKQDGITRNEGDEEEYERFKISDHQTMDGVNDEECPYTISTYTDESDQIKGEIEMERDIVVNKVLNLLDDRERTIIVNYYGLNGEKKIRLKEIGDKIGITAERVRQLKNDAFTKIRNKTKNNKLFIEALSSCIQ